MNRRTACTALTLLLPALAVRAEAGDASHFVEALGRELPSVLAGAAAPAERRARIAAFLERVVDIDGAARFCLGRYWPAATPAQQREYRALFARALTTAVASRADTYASGGSQIVTLPETGMEDGIAVRTIVRHGSQPPVHVTWLVDTSRRPFRIYDVQAEGISLRLTLRGDYTSFLAKHGGDMTLFLDNLRARNQ